MDTIKERLEALWGELGDSVRLVAVSKFHPVDKLREAYDAGQRIFGENRVQELDEKVPLLPKDIEWHFIGTLQRNKVKYIVPYVDTIQSIDRAEILHEVERQAEKKGGRRDRKIKLLLQVHISNEETKHGFSEDELTAFLGSLDLSSLKSTEIVGLMGMAELTDDETVIDGQFARLKSLFDRVKNDFFPTDDRFKELSMGMSGDYEIALRHGATLVRIGTRIFGPREY